MRILTLKRNLQFVEMKKSCMCNCGFTYPCREHSASTLVWNIIVPTDGRFEALAGAASLNTGTVCHQESVTSTPLAKDKILNRLASEFAQNGVNDSLFLQELASGLLKGESPLPVQVV